MPLKPVSIKIILITLKAPYRKTTLLKVMFESGHSVLYSCTDITSKLYILTFLTLVGNYYVVEQPKILRELKLIVRIIKSKLPFISVRKASVWSEYKKLAAWIVRTREAVAKWQKTLSQAWLLD